MSGQDRLKDPGGRNIFDKRPLIDFLDWQSHFRTSQIRKKKKTVFLSFLCSLLQELRRRQG